MPRNSRSRLAEEAQATARTPHKRRSADKAEQLESDLRRLAPAPRYTAEMVRALRGRLGITQCALASLLNTSLSTVQKWETGVKKPGGPSNKLLYLLDRKGPDSLMP